MTAIFLVFFVVVLAHHIERTVGQHTDGPGVVHGLKQFGDLLAAQALPLNKRSCDPLNFAPAQIENFPRFHIQPFYKRALLFHAAAHTGRNICRFRVVAMGVPMPQRAWECPPLC